MTKLREQMIQDMVLRGMAPSTQRAYLQAVTKFARHYNRSPEQISNEELKAYLLYLHLTEKRATSTCNVASVALRFLYHRTLGLTQTDFDVPIAVRLASSRTCSAETKSLGSLSAPRSSNIGRSS